MVIVLGNYSYTKKRTLKGQGLGRLGNTIPPLLTCINYTSIGDATCTNWIEPNRRLVAGIHASVWILANFSLFSDENNKVDQFFNVIGREFLAGGGSATIAEIAPRHELL